MSGNNSLENDEKYALSRIAKEYDNSYLKMIWNKKGDDYDFTNYDGKCALEITSIRSKELIEVMEYENAKNKNGNADVKKVSGAIEISDNGDIYKFFGGNLAQFRNICIESIRRKNDKVIRRINIGQKYERVELCFCIYEAPFFNDESDVDFLEEEFMQSEFDRLFILTRDRFFVMDKS